MHKFLVVLALALLVAGCTDPVRVEKARAIRVEAEADAHAVWSEADTEAMATATAVAIQEKSESMRIAATATAIADNEEVMAQTQEERIVRKENLIWWSTVSGAIVLLAIGVALLITSTGGAVAVVRKAQLEARLVRIDKTTRTWPIMLDTKTGILVDLETGERARIGDIHPLDHRRLIISGQVRTTGLLAQSAEKIAKSTKSSQPGDMLPAIGQSVPLLRGEYKDE